MLLPADPIYMQHKNSFANVPLCLALFGLGLFGFTRAHAEASFAGVPESVQKNFLQQGGDARALSHLNCFLRSYQGRTIQLKQLDPEDRDTFWHPRCSQFDDGENTAVIREEDYAVIVDYTKPSYTRRLFVVPLKEGGTVERYYVGHGRYGNTSPFNTTPGEYKNTVKWINYFSNVRDSNASSSGFYVAGSPYFGAFTGPSGNAMALVLHGLEQGVNDNACRRATVMHGNGYIREWGNKEGVRKMSSGCFTIDYRIINSLIGKIRGTGGDIYTGEPRTTGALFFSYSDREKSLPERHYCGFPENISTFN